MDETAGTEQTAQHMDPCIYVPQKELQSVAMAMLTCTIIQDAITANSGSFFLPTTMLNT